MYIDISILIASLLFAGLMISSPNSGYRAGKLYQFGLLQQQLFAQNSDKNCGQSDPPRCRQSDPPGSGRRE